MNQLTTLKGLIGKNIVQQIGISPSKPFIELLSVNPNNIIFDVHNHHKFRELMADDRSMERNKNLVLDGADEQNLDIIEGLARWFFRHENGEKMPKLTIIGFKDFKFPEWVDFLHLPINRIFNREIVIDLKHEWHEILSEEIVHLDKGGTIILVVPSENDFSDYYSLSGHSPVISSIPADYELEIVLWPDHPSDKKESLFIVPGKTDSKLWVKNVEVIIDLGIESQSVVSPVGGQIDQYVFSDKSRIKNRLLWLGQDREGKHVRLFERNNITGKNLMPTERSRIFKLVNRMKNMTPDFKKYLPLIPETRVDMALNILNKMDIESVFIEKLNYSLESIKIIQNRIKNKKPILGAIFLACLIDFQGKFILWPTTSEMREGDDYERKIINFEDSISADFKESNLETYFDIISDFYYSSKKTSTNEDFSRGHEKWLVEHPHINRNVFIGFLKCVNKLTSFFNDRGAIMMNYRSEDDFLDNDLIYEIYHNYKNRLLRHKIGSTYVDKKDREWLVDLRGSKNDNPPKHVYPLSWKINRFKKDQMIAHLWYKSPYVGEEGDNDDL
jgi:hypothetical protein